MANARKCDLCKKCFDPFSQGTRLMVRFQNPVFQRSKDILENKVANRLIEGAPDAMVDLCPDCTEDFILFMSGNSLAVNKLNFDKPDIPEKKEKTAFQEFLERIDQAGTDFWNDFMEKIDE